MWVDALIRVLFILSSYCCPVTAPEPEHVSFEMRERGPAKAAEP